MTKLETINDAWNSAISFEDYIELIEKLHLEKKATSFPENEEYFNYSVLGLSRMKRIFKKLNVNEELKSLIGSVREKQNWILITESWCGDASQTVPVIAKLATLNENIDLRIVLRDSNLELMDHYLTNGSLSIPILVLFDQDMNELGKWGPRPESAREKVIEYKALPEPRPPYEELSLELQKWYNADKGSSTIREVLNRVKKTLGNRSIA